MLKEFRTFLQRGNVMDLAVAVVIGAAFNAIVNSFVKDLLTPILGALIGKVDLKDLSFSIASVNITYGNFLQAVIEFVIVAFAVFLLIKGINKLKDLGAKKEEEAAAEAAPAEPTPSEALLTEIRDLLKQQGRA